MREHHRPPPGGVARPRDTLATACPTGLQSVCNAILGELRGERSESGEARTSSAALGAHAIKSRTMATVRLRLS